MKFEFIPFTKDEIYKVALSIPRPLDVSINESAESIFQRYCHASKGCADPHKRLPGRLYCKGVEDGQARWALHPMRASGVHHCDICNFEHDLRDLASEGGG